MKYATSRTCPTSRASHPVRGAWIEITYRRYIVKRKKSHPVRGAWIEMQQITGGAEAAQVAPREGCVD